MTQFNDLSALPPSLFSFLRQAKGISSDSRLVQPNEIFVALPCPDEEKHIKEALSKDALVVCQENVRKNQSTNSGKFPDDRIVFVEHARKTLASLCATFYTEHPKILLGITGTNGKSSTVHFVNQILAQLSVSSASIGTLGVCLGNGQPPKLSIPVPDMTTYDSVILHKILQELSQQGVETAALEATSHGLDQYRLDGLRFSAVALTNVTQDHLDYHKTMKNYAQAKTRLFQDLALPEAPAVLNKKSQFLPLFEQACQTHKLSKVFYEICQDLTTSAADFALSHIQNTQQGFEFDLRINQHIFRQVTFPIFGDFQLENLLCALALVTVTHPNLPLHDIVAALSHLDHVPGRLDCIQLPFSQTETPKKSAKVFIDFCHTPDALQRTLRTLRKMSPKRLIVVFGCGGERDKDKRPQMGQVAFQEADWVIVTDDNPRHEDPALIRRDILNFSLSENLSSTKKTLEDIPGRAHAIEYAVEKIQEGDILLIAGRGHEKFQKIGDQKVPFDDKFFVEGLIGKM